DSDAALFMSLLDRTNISFAAFEMNADLGLSLSQYGRGAWCRTCARRTRVRVETRAVIPFQNEIRLTLSPGLRDHLVLNRPAPELFRMGGVAAGPNAGFLPCDGEGVAFEEPVLHGEA